MSVRFEGAHAKYLNVSHVTGGEVLGEDVVAEGQYALVLGYDEVFYIEGTKEELQAAVNRMQAEVDRMPPVNRSARYELQYYDGSWGGWRAFPTAFDNDMPMRLDSLGPLIASAKSYVVLSGGRQARVYDLVEGRVIHSYIGRGGKAVAV